MPPTESGGRNRASEVRSFVPAGTRLVSCPCSPVMNHWAIFFRPPGWAGPAVKNFCGILDFDVTRGRREASSYGRITSLQRQRESQEAVGECTNKANWRSFKFYVSSVKREKLMAVDKQSQFLAAGIPYHSAVLSFHHSNPMPIVRNEANFSIADFGLRIGDTPAAGRLPCALPPLPCGGRNVRNEPNLFRPQRRPGPLGARNAKRTQFPKWSAKTLGAGGAKQSQSARPADREAGVRNKPNLLRGQPRQTKPIRRRGAGKTIAKAFGLDAATRRVAVRWLHALITQLGPPDDRRPT